MTRTTCVRAAILVVVGCASSSAPPLARATDPDACVAASAATEPVAEIEAVGDQVAVCYGQRSCVTVDPARATVTAGGFDEHRPRSPRPPERFEQRSDEEAITLCDRQAGCSRIRIPGKDARTVPVAWSADGTRLYAVVALADSVHLDTFDLRSRRVGRVKLDGTWDHMWRIERVATAVLVGESIPLDGMASSASSNVLVDPLTGAIRKLAQGTAIELDPGIVLAIEGRQASIIDARTLRTLATHTAPGRAIADHSSAAGAVAGTRALVAFTDPPSVATIEVAKHAFGAVRRLPVCAASTYRQPVAPIVDDDP